MAVRRVKVKGDDPPTVADAMRALSAALAARTDAAADQDLPLVAFLRARAADCRSKVEAYRREAEAFEDMARRAERPS